MHISIQHSKCLNDEKKRNTIRVLNKRCFGVKSKVSDVNEQFMCLIHFIANASDWLCWCCLWMRTPVVVVAVMMMMMMMEEWYIIIAGAKAYWKIHLFWNCVKFKFAYTSVYSTHLIRKVQPVFGWEICQHFGSHFNEFLLAGN